MSSTQYIDNSKVKREEMKAKVDRLAEMMKNMIDYCGEDFDAGLAEISTTIEATLKQVWADNSTLSCDCFYQLTIVKGTHDGEYLACSSEKCGLCDECCGECGKNGREEDSDDESTISSVSHECNERICECGCEEEKQCCCPRLCECGCEEEKDEHGHSNRCDTTQFCVQCCDCAYCVSDRCEKCDKVLEAMRYGCGEFDLCKECCDCGDCREETGRCPACGVKNHCGMVGETCDCRQCGECEKYLTYQEFELREDWIFDTVEGVNLCGECK